MEQILDEDISERGPEEYEIASNGKRFWNMFLDYLGIMIFLFLFILIDVQRANGEPTLSQGSPFLFQLVLMFFYSFFLFVQEALMKGRTIGKWITGTKVVDEEGEPASIGKLAIRNLCRMIPFDALSFFGKRGWHDSISHTIVVNSKPKR